MSSPTTGDLLLVNRGGVNYNIDFDDMSTLQDTDLLLVNRGGVNYKMEAQDLGLAPREITSPVEVLTPLDGAGDTDLIYLKSDTITDVTLVADTALTTQGISSVDTTTAAPNVVLSFPSSENFSAFSPGDEVKVTGSEAAFFASGLTDATNGFDMSSSLNTTWVPNPATYPGWVNIGSEFGTTFSALGQNKNYKSANNYSTGKKLICINIGASLDNRSGPLNWSVLGIIPTTQAADALGDLTDAIFAYCGEAEATVKENGVSTAVAGQNVGTGGVVGQRFAFGYDFDNNRAYVWTNNEAVTNADIDAVHPDLTTSAAVVSIDSSASTITVDEDAFVQYESLTSTATYNTEITVASNTDLSQMSTGAAVMTDGVLGGTGYSQTSYTLTTSNISTVTEGSNVVLAFPDAADFDYFKVGDTITSHVGTITGVTFSEYGGTNTYNGSTYTRSKMWDGNISDYNDSTLGPNGGSDYWVWEFPDGIPFSTSLKLRAAINNSGTIGASGLKINGEPVTNLSSFGQWPGGITLIEPTFANSIGNRLYKIEIQAWPLGPAVQALYLDDVIVVDDTYSYTDSASTELLAIDNVLRQLTFDRGPWNVGSPVTLATNGGSGDIIKVDSSANTIYVNNTVGGNDRWIADNSAGTAFALAAGSVTPPPAPTASAATFTSSNAGTTAFSGQTVSLDSRTWTLETAADKAGPWTLVDTYTDTDPVASQDGATAWTTTRPTLSADTWYRVKVAYNAAGADSVESDYHIFKTAV